LSVGDGTLIDTRYRLGVAYDNYQHAEHQLDAYVGWSGGLSGGSTRRLTLGWRVARDDFRVANGGTTLAAIPQNRELSFPYLRLDWIRDDFQTTRNLDLIDRTEDLQYGLNGSVLVGASARALGSDRDAAIVGAAANYGVEFSGRRQLFFTASLNGRLEDGRTRDLRTTLTGAWYWRTTPDTVMHVKVTQTDGSALDLDHYFELGGDNGLRGYPLRYQQGSGATLFKIEERLYTRRSLWRLFDIGAAAFFDAGRVHGSNPLGVPQLGWLKDVGVGLRLGNTRSSLGNVIHIDIATPLDGESRLDRLQLLVGTEATF
jgi:hemolysin activation/secretion protein